MSKLLKATAMVINEIIKTVWKDAMGLTPMPITFKQLHSFLSKLPPHRQDDPTTHYTHINDDLVGFFNALPQQQILQDYDLLVQTYLQQTGNILSTTTFTADLSHKSTSLFRVHTGTIKYSTKAAHNLVYCKTVHLEHIRLIIQTSFTTGLVRVMSMCLQQIQGSTIGNQISPTLCSIPIIVRELQWKRSYNLWHTNHHQQFFLERYVDNRFGVLPVLFLQHPAMQEFNQEWFYHKPVQLEVVDDTHFLGANVHIDSRMVSPILASEPWQLRTPQSAGSLKALLSPFQARAHIISQQTFPKSHIPHYLNQLTAIYIKAGFKSKDLTPIITRLLRKLHLQPTQPPSSNIPANVCAAPHHHPPRYPQPTTFTYKHVPRPT